MSIKIENIPIVMANEKRSRTRELVSVLMELKVGQSFVWDKYDANNRVVVSVVQQCLKIEIRTQRIDGGSTRIGRTSPECSDLNDEQPKTGDGIRWDILNGSDSFQADINRRYAEIRSQ